jgi:hypothetical protein
VHPAPITASALIIARVSGRRARESPPIRADWPKNPLSPFRLSAENGYEARNFIIFFKKQEKIFKKVFSKPKKCGTI